MGFVSAIVRRVAPVFLAATASYAVSAEMPQDRPFSMRGVELGITLKQFRGAAIPDAEDRLNEHATCSNDSAATSLERIELDRQDRDAGIVECKWYSARKGSNTPWEHWVKIGEGGGWPRFRFIDSGGELRLFEILFYANGDYYDDILDALSRGYGEPVTVVEPFKTKGGGDFTSATSVWNNGLSRIILIERCGHLERYCLNYEHIELIQPYKEILERRAAAAAEKI